jgi:hypothetical protein
MATETFKKYGDATIYHDGPRNAEYSALVLGARYDSGVKLGPNGEPALTLAYLNPATPQNGPLRGDLMDSFLVVHDVVYLPGQDLTAIGYSDTVFTYPVPLTPTLEEKLAAAEAEIEALKAQFAASAPAPVVPPVEPVVPPVAPVASEAPVIPETAPVGSHQPIEPVAPVD